MNSTATVQNSNFCPPKSTYAAKEKKKYKENAQPKRRHKKTENPNTLVNLLKDNMFGTLILQYYFDVVNMLFKWLHFFKNIEYVILSRGNFIAKS